MTLSEMRQEYLEEKSEAEKRYKERTDQWIKEHHFDGMVRRKRDGQVGELSFDGYWFNFYPLTKKGMISKKAAGFTSYNDVERDYEPFGHLL